MTKIVLLIKVRVNLMIKLKLQTKEALRTLKKLHILKINETRFGGTTARLKLALTLYLAGLNQRHETCQYASKNCW